MFKIIRKKEWEELENLKKKLEKLNEKLEVLEFQRDYPHNVKINYFYLALGYKRFKVSYISPNNEMRELDLPFAFNYKTDKNIIIGYDEKDQEIGRYKINLLNNVLIEIQNKKDNNLKK